MKLYSDRILTEDGLVAGTLCIFGKTIEDIAVGERLPDAIDCTGKLILPGLIDTHIHGTHGYSLCMEDGIDPQTCIKGYLKAAASTGTTSIFPTITERLDIVPAILETMKKDAEGARVVGIHDEEMGLFLPRREDHMDEEGNIKQVDLKEVQDLVELCQGALKVFSIAPERDQDRKILHYLHENGIRASIAHTDMSEKEAECAIRDGYDTCTHIGNVMKGIHHRDTGTFGACLRHSEMYAEVITDMHHMSEDMIRIVLRCKDADKLILVSDSNAYTGLNPGEYDLPFHGKVTITERGLCRGRGVTSAKPVMFSLRTIYRELHYPLEQCVAMATINPARFYHLDDRKGSLKKGKDADFIIVDDDLHIFETYVEGKKVFDDAEKLNYYNPIHQEAIQYSESFPLRQKQ